MVSRPSRLVPPMECIRLFDEQARLDGVIIVHSTILGPGIGGCRMTPYADMGDALEDALALAEAMNYKHALADLPFGGAKAVLRKPEGDFDRAALFRAFGRVVENLGGSYITAEDVGTTLEDMQEVACVSRHVAGLKPPMWRRRSNASVWTALGVFESMQVVARSVFGRELEDLTVAVQGTGNVGGELCRLLADARARLVIADPRPERRDRLHHILGARVVDFEEIATVDADIFAPCASAGAIDTAMAGALNARLVCGSANNQLSAPHVADLLRARGISYVPDYVVNAGGIVHLAARHLGENRSSIRKRVAMIASRVDAIMAHAAREGRSPAAIADEMAERKIAAALETVGRPLLSGNRAGICS